MNLSHNALRDLTALTELRSVGGILERHFVLLKEHVMKGHLVSAPSLDGLRMSLQLRRIGGISRKTRTARRKPRTAQKKVVVNEFNLLQLLCFCF